MADFFIYGPITCVSWYIFLQAIQERMVWNNSNLIIYLFINQSINLLINLYFYTYYICTSKNLYNYPSPFHRYTWEYCDKDEGKPQHLLSLPASPQSLGHIHLLHLLSIKSIFVKKFLKRMLSWLLFSSSSLCGCGCTSFGILRAKPKRLPDS